MRVPGYAKPVDGKLSTSVIAVGMFDSVHFARWLKLFESQDIRFILFPSSPHRKLHPELESLLLNKASAEFSVAPGSKLLGLPMWVLDKVMRNWVRALYVRFLLRLHKPEFIHALEFQNAGYVVLKALGQRKPHGTIFIATNYGSDIFWFVRKPQHEKIIRLLLSRLDRYAAECERDVLLARELGFTGSVMEVIPNAGGFDESRLTGGVPNPLDRRLIMVKGYHGWVGRAHIAISALEKVAAKVRNYEIIFYSCNASTKRLVSRMARRTGLNVKAYPKSSLNHEEMLEMFSRSLVYVGLSLSDGISTSMLEAMAMGAIPVQTSTACCDEWFGDTGVAVEEMSAENVAKAIEKAIQMALHSDSAARNLAVIKERASRAKIARKVRDFYRL